MRILQVISSFLVLLWVNACHPPGSGGPLAQEDKASIRTLEIPVFENTTEAVLTSEEAILRTTDAALQNLITKPSLATFAESFGELDRIQSELVRVWSRLYLIL
ncbi:MAG TPA: hypothetical protein VFO10_19445 [Oligoflexus sp.]|uniref:hypothetical protein n=1 Tax=Oligoflexus sp. TaxID=1971216 RepID=UPI002D7FFEF5|nr:hypothetical protein [Oligoflexus sp.]HET9239446.1 hypothetical protein [Oligoflexus sp.]